MNDTIIAIIESILSIVMRHSYGKCKHIAGDRIGCFMHKLGCNFVSYLASS